MAPIHQPQRRVYPERVDIGALRLSINQTWASGSSHNIHLLENGDLGGILSNGQPKRNQIPCDAERSTIVVALNVDEDHDRFTTRTWLSGAAQRIC